MALQKDVDSALQTFYHVRDELTIYKELIIRGGRILVPNALTTKLINLAHMTHQGIVRTKQRLLDLCWWKGMDKQVENLICHCSVCHAHDKSTKPVFAPLKPVPLHKQPWQKLGIDIVVSNENAPAECRLAITLLIKVMFISKVDTPTVIKFLKTVFFYKEGYCNEIVSDNGVQFRSQMFEEFLR
uniref:uncharacterized protein K02A2.6-like n=1 Tax=Styela clava TaxID=7725 RepID=UPI00193AB9F2|nr:uncharacterized protein K02A2.6-like [Styela clava]